MRYARDDTVNSAKEPDCQWGIVYVVKKKNHYKFRQLKHSYYKSQWKIRQNLFRKLNGSILGLCESG